ncbi:distal tail protein Dit [Mesobacillus zeae]|uniref:Phage tail family protein n=1 Tax=Mesobacillus zeae TaxID=1917180 RepID=A0A398B7A7_9BACI|nr:distal tail protein Dit [Mesobacillus zeae]RID85677.1 phage tail family protein [Mesobacillus zeae]
MITLDEYAPSHFGLLFLKDHYHPMTPEMREKAMTIPGMDGQWDFGSEWGSRQFKLPFAMIEYDRYELQRKLRALVAFLLDPYGKPRTIKLTFDYEPDKFYEVKLDGKIDIKRMMDTGQFDLSFVAHKPYAKFLVSADEIAVDSDIPVMSDFTIGAEYEFTTNGEQTITVINDGSIAVRPTMFISSLHSAVTVSANGKAFTLNESANIVEVNGEFYTVKVNGVNSLSLMTGDFIELLPGENNVTITGTSVNISFKFYSQYI